MGPGLAILGAVAALSGAAPAACPAGVPVQAITIVNQAGVRPSALAKVESAVTVQSMQLRAAWDTPCVTWAPGGWPFYLRVDSPNEHFTSPIRAYVATSGLIYQAWSSSFSHEVIETLVDPSTQTSYTHGEQGANLEPADPVEHRAYRLRGVYVSDFVLPAWYAGATLGLAATQAGETWYLPTAQVASTDVAPVIPLPGTGPLIAPADAPAPYDEMGVLGSAWQLG